MTGRRLPEIVRARDLLLDRDPQKRLFLISRMHSRLVFDSAPYGGCLIVVGPLHLQSRLAGEVGRGFRVITRYSLVRQVRRYGGVPPENLILCYGEDVIRKYPSKITKDLCRLGRDHGKTVLCVSERAPEADKLFDMARALNLQLFPPGQEYLDGFCTYDEAPDGFRKYRFDPARAGAAWAKFLPAVDARYFDRDSLGTAAARVSESAGQNRVENAPAWGHP